MSTNYVPTATYHSSVTLPSDGDNANAASVNTSALKFLADNDALLKLWSFDLFNNGGTVTPSGLFTFSGTAGYSFTAPLTANTLTTTGNVHVEGALQVDSFIACSSQITAAANIVSSADVHAVDVVASGNSTAATGFTTPGFLVVGGAANVSGTFNVNGNATFTTIAVNSGGTLKGPLVSSGSGRVVPRATLITPSSTVSLGPASFDVVIVAPTTSVALAIDATGVRDGDTFQVVASPATTNQVTVIDPNGGSFVLQHLTGRIYSATYVVTSGTWFVVSTTTA